MVLDQRDFNRNEGNSMNENGQMQVSTIEARDIPEAWFLCLRRVLEAGYEYTIDRGSFEGHTRKELDLVVVQIRQPGIRPLVPDVPQGISPPTTIEYVESYLPYLMSSCKAENEDYTYGKLLEMLIKSNIIPKYYDEFLVHFEKLALGVAKERNLPARGHGQGKKPTLVSSSLAEFTVNLAGAINIFIIKHWIEIRQSKVYEDYVVDENNISL